MTTKFRKALHKGKKAEAVFDRWFAWRYPDHALTPATLQEEKDLGIDRHVSMPDGRTATIEIKLDGAAETTGRLFLETAIVQASGSRSLGWALKTRATNVAVMVPHLWTKDRLYRVFIVKGQELRHRVQTWLADERYRLATSGAHLNDGWHAEGLLVPIGVMPWATEFVIDTHKLP